MRRCVGCGAGGGAASGSLLRAKPEAQNYGSPPQRGQIIHRPGQPHDPAAKQQQLRHACMPQQACDRTCCARPSMFRV